MESTTLSRLAMIGAVICALSPSIVAAQPAPLPYRTVPFPADTGTFRGAIGARAEVFTASRQVVGIPGALWLRLHLGDHNLGTNSYLTITSLEDGASQRLDAATLRDWENSTARFNGSAVEVELHVAPGEDGIFYRIEELTVGEPSSESSQEAICGATDDRTASGDRIVGRIVPVGCTGWIASNGAVLSAGHCNVPAGRMLLFERNVPASLANGATQAPPPADQYPIQQASIVFFNDAVIDDGVDPQEQGQDWAVFALNRNPDRTQSGFYRMSRDIDAANVRITGYGVDNMPAGTGLPIPPPPAVGGVQPPCCKRVGGLCTNNCNANSQTQQSHAGSYQGETIEAPADVIVSYGADTEPGNSGSPVIDTSTGVTIGIHTDGECTGGGGQNQGTGFENDDLETALRNFSGAGANVRHLDNGHPIVQSLQDGTVFRPFDTLAEAVRSVPNGGLISIVTGSYKAGITIKKPMILRAPVGLVTFSGVDHAALEECLRFCSDEQGECRRNGGTISQCNQEGNRCRAECRGELP